MPALETYIRAVKTGQAIWVDQGKHILDCVHVDNLAHAITLALSKGTDRAIYFVTDDEASSVEEFFNSLLATRNMKQGSRSLLSSLVLPMSGLLETLWKLRGSKTPPPITRFFAEVISRDRTYDISKIKKELGYEPVISRAQGLAEMNGLAGALKSAPQTKLVPQREAKA